ncbi:HAD family hydrolase [Pelagerythrobacter rhizovicinus]|uniref:HAD-IB family hydrolase n=1 Tax=Pelagerythrobacter rhizovicinus TaxID=2268576 RepID=A0A4Q2KKJ4_9SPHN|nr:haloacid dehalogenase-like hydrolase [Pelagerythrobacter rhizovicinus]RXZ65778.1 HAD-IB family hydrolase [Pelagerythrobacter rhizovicinus]
MTIYDLDGTLLSGSTFTPFLIFGARRLALWRLLLLPVWIALMIGHKLGLIDRTTLKHRGMRLMLGRPLPETLARVARAFAEVRVARLHPGARRAMEADAREGRRVVIATAAYLLYAEHIARLLDVEEIIASHWAIEGEMQPNCYGPEKLARVQVWLAERGIARGELHLRFVSDSFADAPLLDWADESWFVTSRAGVARRAQARGWQPVNFSR